MREKKKKKEKFLGKAIGVSSDSFWVSEVEYSLVVKVVLARVGKSYRGSVRVKYEGNHNHSID